MRSYCAKGHPDHDACGTGFILRIGEPGSHEVVERALSALQRLAHRGGIDGDGSSGDGARLLTAIPHALVPRVAEEIGLALPEAFALGMVVLPGPETTRVRRTIERLTPEHGLHCLRRS